MKIKSLPVIIAIFLLFSGSGISSKSQLKKPTLEQFKKASWNYFEIMRLYQDWNDRIFGKAKYGKKMLYRYLVDKIYENVLTEYNHVLISPEAIYRQEVRCKFYGEKWLEIIGTVRKESIMNIVGNDVKKIRRWWRARKLVAVYGEIRKFRLDSDGQGKRIVLYLDDVRIYEEAVLKTKGKKK